MMQGLMGVIRGYRVCLFRPERTSSQMSCGRPFLNRTQTEGYRLVWPRPSCRAAFENTAVSAYVSVSVHRWNGHSSDAARAHGPRQSRPFFFILSRDGVTRAIQVAPPSLGRCLSSERPEQKFPEVSIDRCVSPGVDHSLWDESSSPKYRPPNSSDLLTCVWRCVVGQITES